MRAALMLVAGLLVASGCKNEAAPVAAPTPKPDVALPTAGLAPTAGGLHGKLAERLDAPGYTYLRLTNAGAEAWAAVPTTSVAVGTEVTVTNPQPMPGFESKTLGRSWKLIYFGTSAETGSAPTAQAPAANPAPAGDSMQAPHTMVPATPELANIKVAKATGENAKTVAELFADRAKLKDQTVTVRGKAVKVTSGVLGKTWIHLRDGSGSDATKDNDITVTTTETVAVNDELTISGPVHLEKDLGAGYNYPVIIEDAKVTK